MTGRHPVPHRITLALDSLGLYGPEVDRACGVEEPAVDEWEAGTWEPTAEQVEALAALTGFSVDWFYRPLSAEENARRRLFLCRRTGRGKGCEVVETDWPITDYRPPAPVVPLYGQGTLL